MNFPKLIEMLARRIEYLGTVRSSAEALGDIEQVSVLDQQIAESQDTLNKLKASE